MDIEIKDLYKIFVASIKDTKYFDDWKKSGLRKYKRPVCEMEFEVEIERMMSRPREEHISLLLGVRVPANCDPIRNIYGKDRKNGELLFRWNARVGYGVGRRTGAAGREWRLKHEEDVNIYTKEVKETLSGIVPDFFESINSNNKLLDKIIESDSIYINLPLILTLKGKDSAQLVIRGFIESVPESRPPEVLWDWCAENEIISEEIGNKLKHACMQHGAKYKDQLNQIHHEIA